MIHFEGLEPNLPTWISQIIKEPNYTLDNFKSCKDLILLSLSDAVNESVLMSLYICIVTSKLYMQSSIWS